MRKTILTLFLSTGCLLAAFAQQANTEKQSNYRIKIIKNENGKETVIDKTFNSEAELKTYIETIGEDVPPPGEQYRNIKKIQHYNAPTPPTPPSPPTPPTPPTMPDPVAPEMAEQPNIEIITIDEKGDKQVKKITIREEKEVVVCEPGKNGKATITIKDEEGKKIVIRKKMDKELEGIDELDEIENIEGPVNVETTITRDEKGSKVIIKKITIDDAEETSTPGEIRIEKKIEGPAEKEEGNMNGLKFFPNPAEGNLHVEFNIEKSADVKVTITDMGGKEVYAEEIKGFSGSYNKNISRENLAKGQYLLKVSAGGDNAILRILVQ
jgi:hypothetical protein